jgi:hypothetical protein
MMMMSVSDWPTERLTHRGRFDAMLRVIIIVPIDRLAQE